MGLGRSWGPRNSSSPSSKWISVPSGSLGVPGDPRAFAWPLENLWGKKLRRWHLRCFQPSRRADAQMVIYCGLMIILYTYNFLMWLFLIGLISEGNAPWRGQKEPRTSLKILPAQVALYIFIFLCFLCVNACVPNLHPRILSL